MAQITSVTSEALQAKIRELLPSQQGFGEDLQASNVILPTIDLTTAAEGSQTAQNLQTAIAFGSQTSFSVNNSTSVLVNTAGFYRVLGVSSLRSTTNEAVILTMSDGLSTKTVWQHAGDQQGELQVDLTFFIASGISLSAQTTTTNAFFIGSTRQIADVNGTLVQPAGFTPQ